MRWKTSKLLFWHLPAAAVIALLIFFGCPFKRLVGFPCPFCGMTRAYVSLFKLDIAAAFYWHPLFLLGLPTLFYAAHRSYARKKLGKKADTAILCALGIAFAAAYVIRIMLGILPK